MEVPLYLALRFPLKNNEYGRMNIEQNVNNDYEKKSASYSFLKDILVIVIGLSTIQRIIVRVILKSAEADLKLRARSLLELYERNKRSLFRFWLAY